VSQKGSSSSVTLNDIERLVEQNRRLTDEVKKRLDQLAAINKVATLVSQALDLELALEASLAAVMDVINVEATGISLIDEGERELVLLAQRGWKRDFVKMGMARNRK
jgi:predicted transcriptional regulator